MNPSIRSIKKHVANYYNLPVEDIDRNSKVRKFARPRQIAMYLSRELTDLSGSEIGYRFNRDHSTILFGVAFIRGRIKVDRDLMEDVDTIRLLVLQENSQSTQQSPQCPPCAQVAL